MGYDRCYASYLLRQHGRKIAVSARKIIVIDVKKKVVSKRRRDYDEKVLSALKKTWYIMDCICGKRLSPIL
ncbi:MAG: transposase, partial [Nitrospirota bacterium]